MASIFSTISIDSIICDGSVYPRPQHDPHAIETYAAAMLRGDKFPPICVTGIRGRVYLVDGYHRLNAMMRCGMMETQAEVINCGTLEEAYEESVRRNAIHGLRFSLEDKRHIAKRLRNGGKKEDEIASLLRMTLHDFQRIVLGSIERATELAVSRRVGVPAPSVSPPDSAPDFTPIKNGETWMQPTGKMEYGQTERRSVLETRCDILKAIRDEPGSVSIPTHIMYRSNTSWTVLREHLVNLEALGLLKIGRQLAQEERRVYSLTDRGVACLSSYVDLKQKILGELEESTK